MKKGTVALVGAGPADPDLLTPRTAHRRAGADLVLYDALVDPEGLALAASARRVFVGKRAGRPSVTQEFINKLLVRGARRGYRVVRLKGGDPFVFGRGGEEALALVAAGIPFEVVPGVSSSVAAAALSGIPVTHRGVSSAFVVVGGHSEDAYRPVLEGLAPNSATVVVMMGLAHIDALATLLLSRGWKPGTETAVLLRVSTPQAETFTLSLADLARGLPVAEHDGPGTIVIGDVVRLRAMLMQESETAAAAR